MPTFYDTLVFLRSLAGVAIIWFMAYFWVLIYREFPSSRPISTVAIPLFSILALVVTCMLGRLAKSTFTPTKD